MRKCLFVFGMLWLTTAWGGFAQTTQPSGLGHTFVRNYSALEYHGHNRNFAIACDQWGRVYVANFEGLIVYDGVKWTTIHTPGISRVSSLHLTHSGQLWFGGNNVLGNVGTDETVDYVISDNNGRNQVGEIIEITDIDGQIHFATTQGATYCLEADNTKVVDTHRSPAVEEGEDWNGLHVNCRAAITDQRLTALGTTNQGVVVVDEHNSIRYVLNMGNGLCSDNIVDLAYDGKGCLWGATNNGIFAMFVSPIFTHYTESNGLKGHVTDILCTDSHFLVGTLQGVYQRNAHDCFDRLEGIDAACWQMAHTSGRGVLMATAQGVYAFDTTLHPITDKHTLSVAETADGFYAGELDGIYLYDWKGVGVRVGDATNVVKLVKEGDGGMWALNLYGETYYKGVHDTLFEKKGNDRLTLLFEYVDSQGNVWHSGTNNQGLVSNCLSERQLRWFHPLAGYSVQAMQYVDGIAWIGGNFGVIRIDVEQMKSIPMYGAHVYIRSFEHNESNVSFSMSSNKTDPIGITYYSYQLIEKGKWSAWQTDKDINLNHLASGEYALRVRSMDAYGVIVESEVKAFTIPTPFLLRWYSIGMYLLVTVLLANVYSRWRSYRVKKANEELQRQVMLATQELKEAQNRLLRQEREATIGKLTKGLIDRILNPMNYINNFSHLSIELTADLQANLEEEHMTDDVVEDSLDIIGMMRTNLEKIEQHGLSTTRILKAMEELLKERSGKIERVNLTAICKQNIDMFRTYYETDISHCGIQLESSFPEEPVMAAVNAENFSKTIMSLLANSVYATKKKANAIGMGGIAYRPVIGVRIDFPSDAHQAIVTISDNGVGIEPTIIDKIFDPFFTTKPTSEASGVGLYLSQQTVQDWGGTLSAKSEKNIFTELILTIPLTDK